MTLKKETEKKIDFICDTCMEQIEEFVKRTNDQGVMKLFIDFSEFRKLFRCMIDDGIISRRDVSKGFSDEGFIKEFTEFTTEKIIDFIRGIENLDERLEEYGLDYLIMKVRAYLSYFNRPINLFLMMAEFAYPFFKFTQNSVHYYFTFVNYNPDKYDDYMKMIENAIPLGVRKEVKAQSWIEANEKIYRQIDFSEILESIPFSSYYMDAFEEELRNDKPSPVFGNRFMISPKAEIKEKADEIFKSLVLSEVFPRLENLVVETINVGIEKFFEKKRDLFYMLYSKAMMFVKVAEFEKIQQEIRAFCDENGIDYSFESMSLPHPRMFHKNSWEEVLPPS